MTQTNSIEGKILDAFPSGQYALLGMLRLLEVCESEEIETAAVECTWQPRLLINPRFVETWADTPEKLFMLILHELNHILLGHTTLFPRLTKTDNLVFDAVINALLCRMFPGAGYTSLFTDFYEDDCFPECLLRPCRGWKPHETSAIPPALANPKFACVRDSYRALYSETGADYHELFAVFSEALKQCPPMEVTLLGSHGKGQGEQQQIPSALLESIREIVERWPQPPDPIMGRSFSSLLRRSSVCPRTPTSNRNLLRNLLLKIAGSNALKRGSVSWQAPTLLSSPLPTLDRRSLVLRSLGNTPMFYPHEIDGRRRIEQDRVHVYLDVSGSIGDFKSALYGAVLDVGEYVHPAIHLFSTQVFDVSLSQLRRGDCQTTDGTDITCVAGHVRKHKVKRAVIITDGYTGRPTGAAEEALGRTLLGIALTPNGHTRRDLSRVANHWIELGRETK